MLKGSQAKSCGAAGPARATACQLLSDGVQASSGKNKEVTFLLASGFEKTRRKAKLGDFITPKKDSDL